MPDPSAISTEITEEAGLAPAPGEELRVELDVREGDLVRQGQPVGHLRAAPSIALVAPMAARLARVQYRAGHRLVQAVFFREDGAGRQDFARRDTAPEALRELMQAAGLWRQLRSRPFGRMPAAAERAAAIFVMASDSRAGAPDPRAAIAGREEAFARGLSALAGLAEETLFLCGPEGPLPGEGLAGVRRLRTGPLHPMGLAGLHVHRLCPAAPDRLVWDIHAGDVADLGVLLAEGVLPPTRLTGIGGDALRRERLVLCQPGADLRGLSRAWTRPGSHEVLSGSALDGHPAHWLGARDRQATIRTARPPAPRPHWFRAALRGAARPIPVIPTAALAQSLGGALPAAALARALGSGNAEAAIRLGALSLLEEDLALAAHVTATDPPLTRQLRHVLDAVEAAEGS